MLKEYVTDQYLWNIDVRLKFSSPSNEWGKFIPDCKTLFFIQILVWTISKIFFRKGANENIKTEKA